MKQKYTITIADVQMNIVTDEDAESVASLAGVIDRRIREIYLQSGNRCPKTEAALLCALDYCAEKGKLQALVNQYEEEMKETDAAALKEQLATLTAENEDMKKSLAVAEKEIRVAKANVELNEDKVMILAEKAMAAENEVKRLTEELDALRNQIAAADDVIAAPVEVVEETAEAEEEITVEITQEPAEEPATEEPAAEEPIVEETTAEEPVVEETAPVEEPKAPVSALAEESEPPFEIEMKPLRSNVDENQLAFDIADKKVEDNKPTAIEKEKQKAQKRVRSMFDLITFDNV